MNPIAGAMRWSYIGLALGRRPGWGRSVAMELLRLVASQIKVGAPLPFGVRDENAKLLLARGQMIATDSQLETLLSRGIFADKEEIRALAEKRSDAPERKRLTLFDLWEQSRRSGGSSACSAAWKNPISRIAATSSPGS